MDQGRVAQRVQPHVARAGAENNVGVELSVYSPTIEETWKDSGISRLKVDGTLDHKWQEPLEGVVYNAGKYLS
jgi:hypothetical protein